MAFSNQDIQSVWGKGSIVINNDANIWRKDQCGAWIKKSFYGDRNSQYGWEIDHIDTNTDNNDLSNLRPLQWKNNASRQDGRLTCPVIANGVNNVEY
jgi:hypothetical protein